MKIISSETLEPKRYSVKRLADLSFQQAKVPFVDSEGFTQADVPLKEKGLPEVPPQSSARFGRLIVPADQRDQLVAPTMTAANNAAG